MSVNTRTLFLLAAGTLLGLGAWWLTHNYGLGKERVWVGYSGEARVNRFFAARLLLEKLGQRVHQRTSLRELNKLPPRGALMLAASRENLDPAGARNLLSWVDRGGHLIIGAEYAWGHDPLLDMLGIGVEYEEDQRKPGPAVDTVTLLDGTQLRVELMPSPELVDNKRQASWSHEFRDGLRILELRRGEGRVTVFGTLHMFDNREIGLHDHAELLARVLANDVGEVWLIRYLDAPSLLEWLWAHAAETLVALGVFILFWLWRVALRFGPLQPSPEPNRRSLLEHVRALGRFYVDQDQLPELVRRMRVDAQALFDRAAPELHGADGGQRLKEAARLTRIRARDLLAAFTQHPSGPKEFTYTVRTLALFRSRLERRSVDSENP